MLFYWNKGRAFALLFLLLCAFFAGFFAGKACFPPLPAFFLLLLFSLGCFLLLRCLRGRPSFPFFFLFLLFLRGLFFGLVWRSVFSSAGFLLRIFLSPLFALSFSAWVGGSLLLYLDFGQRSLFPKPFFFFLCAYAALFLSALLL